MSGDEQSLIWQTAERMFEDLADDRQNSDALWAACVENGLTLTWVPEAQGGVGGEISDGYDVIRLAGRYAVDVPLIETLIAGRIAVLAGEDVAPDQTTTIAPSRPSPRGEPTRLTAVPFAGTVDTILVRDGAERVQLYRTAEAQLSPRQNDVGAERQDVLIAPQQASAATYSVPTLLAGISRLDTEGAVARSIQIAGALEAVLSMSVQYAREREAFGRPIAKFQAVQHMLAQIAEEVAAALTVSRSAADTLETPPSDEAAILLEVASAKVRVSEAADKALKLAHQVHGAIGITNDYRLQRYARLVIGCRDDFGSPAEWAKRLGEVVARGGGRSIWPTLTTR